MPGTTRILKHPWPYRSTAPGASDSFDIDGLQDVLRQIDDHVHWTQATAPDDPHVGDLWSDTSAAKALRLYNGTQWLPVSTGSEFDVLSYDARGDGATDDSAAFQAAADAAAVHGGVVLVPGGRRYLLGATVTVRGHVHVRAGGPRALLVRTPSLAAALLAVDGHAEDVRLVDLVFVGQGAPAPLVSIGPYAEVVLDGLRFESTGWAPLEVQPGAGRPTLIDPDPQWFDEREESTMITTSILVTDYELASVGYDPVEALRYADGDYVGNGSIAIPPAVPGSGGGYGIQINPAAQVHGGGGTIQSFTLYDLTEQGVPMDLFFFNNSGWFSPEDNWPWTLENWASHYCVGMARIETYVSYGAGQGLFGFATFPNGPIAYKCESQSLWIAMVTRGTPIYTKTSLRMRVGLYLD